MPRKKKLSGDALREVNDHRAHEVALTWAHIALRDMLKESGVPAIEAIRIERNTAALLVEPIAHATIKAKQSNRSSKGGEAGAETRKAKAEKWHSIAEDKARKLLADGVPARELASRLAPRLGVSADRVRRHLKKVGVK